MGQCYAQIIFSLRAFEIVVGGTVVLLLHFSWAEVAWIAGKPTLHSRAKAIPSTPHHAHRRLDFPEDKTRKELDCAPPTTGKQSKEKWMGRFPCTVVSLRQEKLYGLMGYTWGLLLRWDVAVPD